MQIASKKKKNQFLFIIPSGTLSIAEVCSLERVAYLMLIMHNDTGIKRTET